MSTRRRRMREYAGAISSRSVYYSSIMRINMNRIQTPDHLNDRECRRQYLLLGGSGGSSGGGHIVLPRDRANVAELEILGLDQSSHFLPQAR